MMNIIRADIYRILRGRAIYFTFAALLALNVLIVSTSQNGTIGVAMDEIEASLGVDSEVKIYNGINIAEVLYTGMDNIIYFLLPLFILAAAPMFTHSTIKNSLSCGMSRTKLYLEKLVVNSVFCAAVMVFYMITGMLTAAVLRGFGGTPPDGYWLNIIKICSAQLLMILALGSFATFLIFTAKRTSVVIAVYIAFCFVPAILVMALTNIDAGFVRIYDFDLTGNIRKLGFMDALNTADFVKAFAVAAFYIVVPTFFGITLFKRAEIK